MVVAMNRQQVGVYSESDLPSKQALLTTLILMPSRPILPDIKVSVDPSKRVVAASSKVLSMNWVPSESATLMLSLPPVIVLPVKVLYWGRGELVVSGSSFPS